MYRALVLLALAAMLAAPARAGGGAPSETSMDADGLLLSGEGASAGAEAPAELVLDLARAADAPSGILEVALTPERVVRSEPFLVSVTADAAGGPTREIASIAFFPPPREGETQRFLIDVSELPESGKATLSVRLVPATDAPLTRTRLRVEGLALPE
ncbi:hypothetical protein [Arenibaculum sp.]|jgi:hypothetical protein|uniref:hypothetical protein n=1 Tax=Arenibaculum sp. TaxID=2865862 RepID=UPI002E0D2636|nr:hypothetical protein [Arenibaculum sp.]